jgi:hypothetical protein
MDEHADLMQTNVVALERCQAADRGGGILLPARGERSAGAALPDWGDRLSVRHLDVIGGITRVHPQEAARLKA